MYKNSPRSPGLIAAFLLIAQLTFGQNDSSVRFTVTPQRVTDSSIDLVFRARIMDGARLYGLKTPADTTFFSALSYQLPGTARKEGDPKESGALVSATDTTMGSPVRYATDTLEWRQSFVVRDTGRATIKGKISYSYFRGGAYLTGEYPFKAYIIPAASASGGSGSASANGGSGSVLAGHSLWWVFLAAFGGGLLALLTPCVYSMIPITVSFFTKRSRTRAEGRRNAIGYAASIVTIFTVIGFAVTFVFGPAALNNLATNWIANLIFFILFLAFGISFLGAFEIALPGSWSNQSDAKAGMGSIGGIFFMALTLVIVSFSCTGPIIGNLLVLAAHGSYYGPLIGMLGFSLALALPFAFFAFFPSKLNVLGKAGGWLNAVKVTLGFLELALALKFLSNADLSRGWRLLDREIFLSLWIVIFLLLGIYLLGKIKFRHDDELPKNDFGLHHLSVLRLLFALAALAFSLYLLPGMWGAPLKGVSAFLPPMGTQDFNASAPIGKPAESGAPAAIGPAADPAGDRASAPAAIHPAKYVPQMKIYEPEAVTKYGLVTYFDYDEALAAARAVHKPLMLDFTGINCVNCRKMEGEVWSDPVVIKLLKNDFVIVSLYVDVQNVDLPMEEQYYSKGLGRKIETLGDKNADLQVTRFGANTQPYYFFLDGKEQKLVDEGYGYDPDIPKFIAHLNRVLEKVKNSP
jgi:cytochrome c biogenesis protein CcdA/thioredoxin-related protein